jgi:hypothetical protein
MNVDCTWLTRNLESYFCDGLSPDDDRLARSHIQQCAKCREEIQSFTAIDSLMQKYFHQQLALAQNRRRRSMTVIYAGTAATVLAAMLVVVVSLRTPENRPESNTAPLPHQVVAVPDTTPPMDPVIKNDQNGETTRAKPGEPAGPQRQAASSPGTGERTGFDVPEFLVTDPAGYSRTLQDYRGYTLVLGIWSSDVPESIAAMERIYRTFSANTQLRILGVSRRREGKPANTTFPIAYNQGSRLLNAQAGEFVLVDPAGSILRRGSLTTEFDDLAAALKD